MMLVSLGVFKTKRHYYLKGVMKINTVFFPLLGSIPPPREGYLGQFFLRMCR